MGGEIATGVEKDLVLIKPATLKNKKKNREQILQREKTPVVD